MERSCPYFPTFQGTLAAPRQLENLPRAHVSQHVHQHSGSPRLQLNADGDGAKCFHPQMYSTQPAPTQQQSQWTSSSEYYVVTLEQCGNRHLRHRSAKGLRTGCNVGPRYHGFRQAQFATSARLFLFSYAKIPCPRIALTQ